MKKDLKRILLFSLTIFILCIIPNVKAQEKYEVYKINTDLKVRGNNILGIYEQDAISKLVQEEQKDEQVKELEEDKNTDLTLQNQIVGYALQFVGNPYVSGGTSLTNGTDCSGFTMSVYASFGYSIPRTVTDQAYFGEEISIDNIQIGDIVIYGYNGYYSHSAMYIGNGTIVHASTPEGGIRTDNMYMMPIMTIRRIIY